MSGNFCFMSGSVRVEASTPTPAGGLFCKDFARPSKFDKLLYEFRQLQHWMQIAGRRRQTITCYNHYLQIGFQSNIQVAVHGTKSNDYS